MARCKITIGGGAPGKGRRRRPTHLARGAVAVLAVLSGVALVGADPAAAQAPEANLATTALKITGRTVSAGATIPAATALSPVTLTTADPDSGPQGLLGLNADPYTLVRGETVTFRAAGVRIATTVPDLFPVELQTNKGTLTTLAFVAGRDTYLLPALNQTIGGVSTVTAPSKLSAGSAGSLVTYSYGLLPQGAAPRPGLVYAESSYAGATPTVSVRSWLLHDADDVRRNADSVGDEVAIVDFGGQVPTSSVARLALDKAEEVTAFAQLGDGRIVPLTAVRIVSSAAYGPTVSQYLFDEVGLSQAGASIGDVKRVVGTASTDHALPWSQLGF